MTSSLGPLLSLVAPLLLWPVETFLPYPELLEEPAKFAIIAFSSKSLPLIPRLRLAAIIGLAFAFSESVLYMLQYLQLGTLELFWLRLAYTIPLHAITCLIMAIPNPARLPFGLTSLPLAIAIHFTYNSRLFGYLTAP